jgi:hypothetical protein
MVMYPHETLMLIPSKPHFELNGLGSFVQKDHVIFRQRAGDHSGCSGKCMGIFGVSSGTGGCRSIQGTFCLPMAFLPITSALGLQDPLRQRFPETAIPFPFSLAFPLGELL